MSSPIHQQIDNDLSVNPVMLYMKGSPAFPQCGFSAAVVSILNALGVTYESCDVLSNTTIRQGIKDYANWPTVPQLYVKGEFVGGCDIVREMHETGELKQLLEDQGLL